MPLVSVLLVALTAALPLQAQRRPAAAPVAPFKTSMTQADMTGRQAVVETSADTLVIDLRPDLAPNHVGYFIRLAREAAYSRTAIHRVVRDAIIQGGDPLSKDPSKGSFFIVTAAAPTLDGKYTVFGRVIDGLDVVDRIESAPVSGESPTTRIDLIKVRIAG